jgi:hypothetical protein
MSKNLIFYIDPQSYKNLAVYDYELLHGIKDVNIVVFGSKEYDYKTFPQHIKFVCNLQILEYKFS